MFIEQQMQSSFSTQKTVLYFNPLPEDNILDQFKLKQIADDILKCI